MCSSTLGDVSVSPVLRSQAERPSRKRRDSFGLLDGLEEERSSCSAESSGGSGASSPEDSDEEELGGGGGVMQLTPSPSSSSLTLIKTNGQVYTYPDGKAGMGQSQPLKIVPTKALALRINPQFTEEDG